ncbi:hypothetical protein [Microbispora bryophytorum]|uniref:hypothetical protein n=1 Tax=Microbispora bryophytorum TaxID=1460882 RepID=UPI0034004F0A
MRQIADAAGTDVAYVRRRFGDKREICLEVMDRMNSAHDAVLEKGQGHRRSFARTEDRRPAPAPRSIHRLLPQAA